RASAPLLVSFFFSSRRRHTSFSRDWSSDVCSSDLGRSRKLAASRRTLFRSWFRRETSGVRISASRVATRRPLTRSNSLKPSCARSEERRVGKECRSGWSPYHEENEIRVGGAEGGER